MIIKYTKFIFALVSLIFINNCNIQSKKLQMLANSEFKSSKDIIPGFNIEVFCDKNNCSGKNIRKWVNIGFRPIYDLNNKALQYYNIESLKSKIYCSKCYKNINRNCFLNYAFKNCNYTYSVTYSKVYKLMNGFADIKPIYLEKEKNKYDSIDICINKGYKEDEKDSNIKNGLNIQIVCLNNVCMRYKRNFFINFYNNHNFLDVLKILSKKSCPSCDSSLLQTGEYKFKNCSYIIDEQFTGNIYNTITKGYTGSDCTSLQIKGGISSLLIFIDHINLCAYKRIYLKPKYDISMSNSHKDFVTLCHNKSLEYVSNILLCFETFNIDDNQDLRNNYEKYFGEYNDRRFNCVVTGFKNLSNVLEHAQILYKYKNKENNVVAFVKISNNHNLFLKIINLCSSFFNYQNYSKSKAERLGACAIIHELSHVTFNTIDKCYGYTECVNLAKMEPDLSIKNADSFDFFTQNIIQNKCYPH